MFEAIFVILIAYALKCICFPKDYTEVDVIMEEYRAMRESKE